MVNNSYLILLIVYLYFHVKNRCTLIHFTCMVLYMCMCLFLVFIMVLYMYILYVYIMLSCMSLSLLEEIKNTYLTICF